MEIYKNEKEFEDALQEMDDCPDNVQIGDIVFTMDNYDLEGKEISFGNKRTCMGFNINTSNRYKNGLKDADVSEIQENCLRNDLVYLD